MQYLSPKHAVCHYSIFNQKNLIKMIEILHNLPKKKGSSTQGIFLMVVSEEVGGYYWTAPGYHFFKWLHLLQTSFFQLEEPKLLITAVTWTTSLCRYISFPMNVVQASRAAEKARRIQEKAEWDNVVKIFVLDDKKKSEALDLLHAQPLAKTRSGAFLPRKQKKNSFKKNICWLC